jgi:hypothetical protein
MEHRSAVGALEQQVMLFQEDIVPDEELPQDIGAGAILCKVARIRGGIALGPCSGFFFDNTANRSLIIQLHTSAVCRQQDGE